MIWFGRFAKGGLLFEEIGREYSTTVLLFLLLLLELLLLLLLVLLVLLVLLLLLRLLLLLLLLLSVFAKIQEGESHMQTH